MSSDARILYLVRQEVDRLLHVVAPSPVEVRHDPDWVSRLDELHAEIHSLATKLAELEKRLSVDPAPKTVAAPARKSSRVSG